MRAATGKVPDTFNSPLTLSSPQRDQCKSNRPTSADFVLWTFLLDFLKKQRLSQWCNDLAAGCQIDLGRANLAGLVPRSPNPWLLTPSIYRLVVNVLNCLIISDSVVGADLCARPLPGIGSCPYCSTFISVSLYSLWKQRCNVLSPDRIWHAACPYAGK